MMLRLAAEQARSHRRYTLWTAGFMTAALALITFALCVIQTEYTVNALNYGAVASSRVHHGFAQTLPGRVPGDEGAYVHSTEEIDAALDAAISAGSDVVASRVTYVDIVTVGAPPSGTDGGDSMSASDIRANAVRGDYDWTHILAGGRPPGDGEIVLSARVAAVLGVSIGDPVVVGATDAAAWERESWGLPVPRPQLTVSGILQTNVALAGSTYSPTEALLPWGLSNEPGGLFTLAVAPGDGTVSRTVIGPFTTIAYSVGAPALAVFANFGYYQGAPGAGDIILPLTVPVTLALAAALILASLIGAFAVGRSQGRIRVRWVATARTLGASRRDVRVASLVETALVAAVAIGSGIVLGYAFATLRLFVLQSGVDYPLAPAWVPFPWWIPALVAAAGIVLAIAVAASPAFWASRVPPVAALKPVADITAAPPSRGGSLWWIVPAFVAAAATVAVASDGTSAHEPVMIGGAVVALAPGLLLLLKILHRVIPAVGRRLSRSRRLWLMVAGDAITARPRQASMLALLASVPGFLAVLVITLAKFAAREGYLFAKYHHYPNWPAYRPGPLWEGGDIMLWATLGTLVVLQVIAVAVTVSWLRATGGEQATRRALGLDEASSRRATAAQHMAPQVVGGLLGAASGFVIAVYVHFCVDFGTHLTFGLPQQWGLRQGTLAEYAPVPWYAFVSSVVFGAVAAVFLVAGAAAVTRLSRGGTPVEALRPAGKVSVR